VTMNLISADGLDPHCIALHVAFWDCGFFYQGYLRLSRVNVQGSVS